MLPRAVEKYDTRFVIAVLSSCHHDTVATYSIGSHSKVDTVTFTSVNLGIKTKTFADAFQSNVKDYPFTSLAGY